MEFSENASRPLTKPRAFYQHMYEQSNVDSAFQGACCARYMLTPDEKEGAASLVSRQVPPSATDATIFQHCHWRKCTKAVLAANGGVIPGVGKKVGRYIYCPPHATQHVDVLRKDNARRAKKQMKRAKLPAGC